LSRSSLFYQAKRPRDDALRKRLKDLAPHPSPDFFQVRISGFRGMLLCVASENPGPDNVDFGHSRFFAQKHNLRLHKVEIQASAGGFAMCAAKAKGDR